MSLLNVKRLCLFVCVCIHIQDEHVCIFMILYTYIFYRWIKTTSELILACELFGISNLAPAVLAGGGQCVDSLHVSG